LKPILIFVRKNIEDYYFIMLDKILKNLGVKLHYPEKIDLFFPIFRNLVKCNCKILHIHWLYNAGFYLKNIFHLIFKLLIFIIEIIIIKYLLKVKIVWTVHNLYAHDSKFPSIEKIGKIWFSKQVDKIICHCNIALNKIAEEFKADVKKIQVIPHGHYLHCYKNTITKFEARKILSLGEKEFIFLYFGRIKPYKGIDNLIKSFNSLNLNLDIKLLVAGEVFNKEIGKFLVKSSQENKNIILYLERIKDDDIQIYMNASDVVVIPYKQILTSGSILLAMTFAKPIIAPKIGCIKNILDEKGSILYDLEDNAGLKNAMEKILNLSEKLDTMGAYNYQKVKEYDWNDIGLKLLKIYDSLQTKK